MYLKKLILANFKNYVFAELDFSDKMNCFSGNNGSGKTNLLDAIHYLSFTKSYFNLVDQQNIRLEEDFFRIEGQFSLDGDRLDTLECIQERNHRKLLRLNKKEYERLADHIGLIPLVMISPADSNLIYGGSEDRRKYFDSVVSQFDKLYMEDLINYQKILFHRNKLLKQFAESRTFDRAAIELWDLQLATLGTHIHEKRLAFIQAFRHVFNRHFAGISGGKEDVEIIYESTLEGADFAKILQENMEHDRYAAYTTQGIHKDDFQFLMHGMPLKKFGSQGQQKSFMIAVKLAQFDYTRDIKGYKPLLLLDDVFDKLDDQRVENLLKLVSEDHFGQIFITDTSAARLQHAIEKTHSPFAIFSIDAGQAEPLKME